jgi:uncharacterized protein YcfJ
MPLIFALLFAVTLFLPLPLHAEGSGDGYRPEVEGTMGPKYNKDVKACQRAARKHSTKAGDVATGAAVGAGGGALIGGAISGDYGLGALAGAVAGGVGGHISDEDDREQYIRDCMEEKGYELSE